jgi:flagellin
MNQALSELSTGKKINSAADDPSGLTISEQMQGQTNGLNQANSNTQNGISLIQTAEGGLTQTSSILQTMRELAVQAANGTNTTTDLTAIQDQINQYTAQIDNIANTTQFNTMNLLNGSVGLNVSNGAVVGNASDTSLTKTGTYNVNAPAADFQTAAALNVTAATTLAAAGVTGPGTLTINGKNIAYTIAGPAETYGQLATAINTSGAGVTASFNSTGMVIATNTAGATLAMTDTITGAHGALGANVAGAYTNTGAASLATAATETTAAAANTAATNTVGVASGTLVVNGVQVNYSNGETYQNLVNSINSSVSGVTASFGTNGTGPLQIVTNAVGANATLSITDAGGVLGSGVNAPTLTQGANASGAIINDSKGNDAAAGEISYNGNTVTVNGGEANGLQFNLLANGTSNVTVGNSISLQIGANQGQTMSLSINAMGSSALGIGNLDLTSSTGAQNAITTIDSAISTVSAQNSTLGAYQDRLQYTSDNLTAASQNLTTANSTLTNVDMASEMSQYTQDSILVQAATSMLAQANQEPQTVLKLLQ